MWCSTGAVPGCAVPGSEVPRRAPRASVPPTGTSWGQRHTCVSTRTTTARGEGVPRETGRALSEVNLSISTHSFYIVNITTGFLHWFCRLNLKVVVCNGKMPFGTFSNRCRVASTLISYTPMSYAITVDVKA